MRGQYYSMCSECEYFYHCFDEEEREKIKEGDSSMYLRPESCTNFYPEVEQ